MKENREMCWRVTGERAILHGGGVLMKASLMVHIRGKFKWPGGTEAFQTGQTSWDLPAFSHWLPDLGQIPAAEWRVFLRAVSPPD